MQDLRKAEKIKITTQLISEKYKSNLNVTIDCNEPKHNTSVQRTWIGRKDAAIRAVEELGVDNTKDIILPPIDNELSLPLPCNLIVNALAESLLNTMRSKTINGCRYRRSEITKTMVKPFNLRKY